MLSVKTPSFAEYIGKVRSELTRGILLNILRLKKSWPKPTWPNSNPIFRNCREFEILFLLCALSVVCYTATAPHFSSQLCFCPRAQTFVVDPLDRAMLRHYALSKESTCLDLHMRLEIQLAFET